MTTTDAPDNLFPPEKRARLRELIDALATQSLTDTERRELDALVDEELAASIKRALRKDAKS